MCEGEKGLPGLSVRRCKRVPNLRRPQPVQERLFVRLVATLVYTSVLATGCTGLYRERNLTRMSLIRLARYGTSLFHVHVFQRQPS